MNPLIPDISVIIPTHNRSASLRRTLDALSRQRFPLDKLEVIVVADGCSDDTTSMLKGYGAQFALHAKEQPGRGAAAARNHGASCAKAPILLFLDDDVEPIATTIDAHVRAHARHPGHVIVGPYPLALDRKDYFRIRLCAWWESFFESMLTPGHRFTYQDIVSGNLSIGAQLFQEMEGLVPTFPGCGGEDFEFGIRLIQARVPIAAVREALAYHHDSSDVQRSFARKRQEGRTDVMIARKHPTMTTKLKFAQLGDPVSLLRRILRRTALSAPWLGDRFADLLQLALTLSEQGGLRLYWRRCLNLLEDYWYCRGVGDQVHRRPALLHLLREGRSHSDRESRPIEVDLAEGLKEAEARLDNEQPPAAIVWYGRHLIGSIPAHPGAEPLRGLHLRSILANRLAVPLLEALIREEPFAPSASIDQTKLAQSLGRVSTWFGPVRPGEMWYEQAGQWNRVKEDETASQQAAQDHWDRYRQLHRETVWLKAECGRWRQVAEDHERTLKQRGRWTSVFEQQKANVTTR